MLVQSISEKQNIIFTFMDVDRGVLKCRIWPESQDT